MFAGVMVDLSKAKIPCDNGPYRDGKGTLYEGATRVCAFVNWPGHIKPGTVDGLLHAVDIYPTLAAVASASTGKCKPLDGVNVWDAIAGGKPPPRTEIVYNVEPFRGAVRQSDWKLVWRTLLPFKVELFNLAQDSSEKNNLAAQYPDKVVVSQQRLDELAKQSEKPLFLVDQFKVVTKGMHGEPILPTDEDFAGVEEP
jgi:arylsulfatase B